jgi:hypothetical protein
VSDLYEYADRIAKRVKEAIMGEGPFPGAGSGDPVPSVEGVPSRTGYTGSERRSATAQPYSGVERRTASTTWPTEAGTTAATATTPALSEYETKPDDSRHPDNAEQAP